MNRYRITLRFPIDTTSTMESVLGYVRSLGRAWINSIGGDGERTSITIVDRSQSEAELYSYQPNDLVVVHVREGDKPKALGYVEQELPSGDIAVTLLGGRKVIAAPEHIAENLGTSIATSGSL